MGFGLALFYLPLSQIIMAGISPAEIASAAGLSNFVRTFAGSVSTAVCVFMWTDLSEHHYAKLTENITPDSVAWADYQAQMAQAGLTGDAALASTARVLNVQAMTMGANDLFLMMGVMFLLLIPFVWFAKPPFRAVGTGGAH